MSLLRFSPVSRAVPVAVAFALCVTIAVPDASAVDYGFASRSAAKWLAGRVHRDTGFVDSYADAEDVCYTYDQSLAAIAFLARNDAARAKTVLDALRKLQQEDGSWYTAYRCGTLAAHETARHVGPALWVALAAREYAAKTRDARRYAAMAERAADWALTFQRGDGGIDGGRDFDGSVLTWASTEHNIDAYPVLRWLGRDAEAARVKAFLDDHAWDDREGYFRGGRDDPRDPLDVNAWGVAALGGSGTHLYSRAVDYAGAHHRATISRKSGRRTTAVDGFDFDSNRDDVWLEGTAQMALAYAILGRTADADHFLAQIVKAQGGDGGVPYSLLGTHNGYWTMSKDASVAATAWLVIAAEGRNPLR